MLVLVVCRQPQKEETGVHSKVRPPALFPPRESSAPPRQMSHVHRVAHCTFIHHCKTSNQPHYFESTAVVTEAEFVSQGKCWATFHLNRAFVKHPRNTVISFSTLHFHFLLMNPAERRSLVHTCQLPVTPCCSRSCRDGTAEFVFYFLLLSWLIVCVLASLPLLLQTFTPLQYNNPNIAFR